MVPVCGLITVFARCRSRLLAVSPVRNTRRPARTTRPRAGPSGVCAMTSRPSRPRRRGSRSSAGQGRDGFVTDKFLWQRASADRGGH
jgi:hypothetical protein